MSKHIKDINTTSVTAIILTYNEELHIQRCIDNLKNLCVTIYVIDSFSKDNTCEIAKECGAIVIQHEYKNQAQQFQWALDNCKIDTEWVMRMDADEYLTEELKEEIRTTLPTLSDDISGCTMSFHVKFLGRELKHGVLRPARILRLWRNGSVYMEQRWMDERLVLKHGKSIDLKGLFIDENLNGLTAWTAKHNNYSCREVAVVIGNQYGVFNEDESLSKRNAQKSTYYQLPAFFRAFCYFFARYILFLGFLDGKPGFIWATLQAYWYRFLVDAKIEEMECRLGKNPTKEQVKDYIRYYYHINI